MFPVSRVHVFFVISEVSRHCLLWLWGLVFALAVVIIVAIGLAKPLYQWFGCCVYSESKTAYSFNNDKNNSQKVLTKQFVASNDAGLVAAKSLAPLQKGTDLKSSKPDHFPSFPRKRRERILQKNVFHRQRRSFHCMCLCAKASIKAMARGRRATSGSRSLRREACKLCRQRKDTLAGLSECWTNMG